MFLGILKYEESDEQYCFSKRNCNICIFGFQIYLFFKTHSNGLSNKFIPNKTPKNVCNFWTLVLGCSHKHGHWDTHVLLKYSQTKIQIFEQNLPHMLAEKSIAGFVVLLICSNYSKIFLKLSFNYCNERNWKGLYKFISIVWCYEFTPTNEHKS